MMTFFDRRFYKRAFDELITFYPRYYRDIREMIAILKTDGRLMDGLYDNAEIVYNDSFIDYMGEDMIERLEKFLGLNAGNRTLEERRSVIKTYFMGFGHLSATVIKEMIKSFGDVDVDVLFEPFDEKMNNALYITITQDDDLVLDMETILRLLKLRVPAHIRVVIDDTIQIYDDFRAVERFFFTNLTLTMHVNYLGYKRLDGTWLLDGSVLLDGCHIPLHIELINTFHNQIVETDTLTIATCHPETMWLLDGTYLLDGEKMLGADYVEEVV